MEKLLSNYWFILYFSGVILSLILLFILKALETSINYLTGKKNVEINYKRVYGLEYTARSAFTDRYSNLIYIILCLSSWLASMLLLIDIAFKIFSVLKNILNKKPEKLREIQYPLCQSKNLPLEKAWALMAGQAFFFGFFDNSAKSALAIIDELELAKENNHEFDKVLAVDNLAALNLFSVETIEKIKRQI